RVTQLAIGQKARIVVDAVGEAHPYTGKIVEIAGSAIQRAGQQSKVFEVKIQLDTVDAKLRPGMTAKARIETERADHVVTIPIQAVMIRPEKDLVAAAAPPAKGDAKTEAKTDPKTDPKTDAKARPKDAPQPPPSVPGVAGKGEET